MCPEQGKASVLGPGWAPLPKARVKMGILLGQASRLERFPLLLGVSPLLSKWDTNLG